MKLILFDIDGTLIRSHSAGRTAMGSALMELFGTSGPIESYHMSGKTDPRIITDLLLAAGINADEIKEKLPIIFDRMRIKAKELFPTVGIIPCEGVLPLLAELNKLPNVILGLLTGNINSTAPLKLKAAGIQPGLFKIGAFGSDAMDRNELPAIAMDRANKLTKNVFTGNNTVIIGDTPADILCARAGNATAIAVASGWHSASTLLKYQPDYLLDNLIDTPSILKILLNG